MGAGNEHTFAILLEYIHRVPYPFNFPTSTGHRFPMNVCWIYVMGVLINTLTYFRCIN